MYKNFVLNCKNLKGFSKAISLIKPLLNIFLFIFVLTGSQSDLKSQFTEDKKEGVYFFFDAVCFKGMNDSLARIDIYVLVPYQTLHFLKSENQYGASYSVTITAIDTNGNRIKTEIVKRNISEEDYAVSQGSSGKFDYSQTIFYLKNGNYSFEVFLRDEISKAESKRIRSLSVLDFDKYPLSISSILLVSSIEEKENGGYLITPHISDNIAELNSTFFGFFEIYNRSDNNQIDLIYQILDSQNKEIYRSKRFPVDLNSDRIQKYLPLEFPRTVGQGTYKLVLLCIKKDTALNFSQMDILAASERTLQYFKTVGGMVLQDLSKAIKQIRYIGNQDDIDYIEAGTTNEERQKRFEEFWKKHDPSPTTERNEAYEQYYARIEIANKRFKSYTEGWRTDMGMVFVILGEPINIEKSSPYGDQRTIERWTYGNNQQYIFLDNTGFGDYRLYSPITVHEKYQYQN